MADQPLIHVVDDDASMRRALERLLRSANFRVEVFSSAHEFLGRRRPGGGCLLLDLRMPGMTGLELQQRLVSTDPGLPVILITAHATERSRQQALAAGASGVLNKPFEDRELLEAVERAIGGARPAGS